MFIHTEESLEELEDYIKKLEEEIGLTPSTAIEVYKAIDKQKAKLKALNIELVSVTEGELCFNCGQVPAVNEHTSLCKECYDNWSKGKAIETN